jgi:hypothetical protein
MKTQAGMWCFERIVGFNRGQDDEATSIKESARVLYRFTRNSLQE